MGTINVYRGIYWITILHLQPIQPCIPDLGPIEVLYFHCLRFIWYFIFNEYFCISDVRVS